MDRAQVACTFGCPFTRISPSMKPWVLRPAITCGDRETFQMTTVRATARDTSAEDCCAAMHFTAGKATVCKQVLTALTSISVVLPAPEPPISAVRTPGRHVSVSPCLHTSSGSDRPGLAIPVALRIQRQATAGPIINYRQSCSHLSSNRSHTVGCTLSSSSFPGFELSFSRASGTPVTLHHC